jgi:uncharacterized protein YceK
MKRKITVFVAIATPLAAALIVAGCGSSATKAGQTNGAGSNDFGGVWDMLSPAGKKVESGG